MTRDWARQKKTHEGICIWLSASRMKNNDIVYFKVVSNVALRKLSNKKEYVL
jgi:hypothetical protein